MGTDICVKFSLVAVVQDLNRKGRLRTHCTLTVRLARK